MSSYISRGSTRSDIMDDDGTDKDDTKRRSRNLSEKKRRDQFNMLINELSSMVSTNSRKMDKSTVLKSTIAFLKNHNEIAVRSRAHEIQEDWKPSFLSNEEFTHLILEALDGFIIVFSLSGQIIYISESITSLLGHLPSDLLNSSVYDLVSEEDYKEIFNVLNHPAVNIQYNADKENKISFTCHCKRNDIDSKDGQMYEPVQFIGYFRSKTESTSTDSGGSEKMYEFSNESDSRYLSSPDDSNESKRLIFVGTGRLETPQLIREMSVVDSAKSEFTSRHSLEWKFLFLDHRAPPIIGYLPFEVLGTSGYDYYHVDDLDKVVLCHEALMQKGEGTSCFYRFLTKGQQWIWLQTRFYITYHQWTSKPEFIVCTHQVVSYLNVMKQMRRQAGAGVNDDSNSTGERSASTSASAYRKSSNNSRSNNRYLSKCSKGKSSHYESRLSNKSQFYTPGDSSNSTTSLSTDSSSLVSRHHTSRQRTNNASSHSSQQIPQSRSMSVKPQPAMTFYEMPPAVYNLAAVPSYPIQGTVSPNVPPELLRTSQPLVMASNQSEIQDQLQRKHEELQQLIVQQQEELRKIHEQLIMAKCGFLPPMGNAPTLCPGGSESSTSVEAQANYASRPAMMLNLHQPNVQAQSSEELIPYQMSQQQAQLLLSSNMTTPNS
ncbi:unnamed protein product [Bemisia tabaci]|uniref:Circadian locomoter output cycles protein kaput n=1 Tax=Bemisia tabaci TaxID=7038 RepID=A0A9P0F3V3_BEMTA|nr:unnamed protein product [Bemisia tabaci]